MKQICLYFQVHQPRRLHPFDVFDIGSDRPIFDDILNIRILHRVCHKGYEPANELLMRLIQRFGNRVHLAFSLSGTVMEQMATYKPQSLKSFQDLASTGCVEFLGETYYLALSFLLHEETYAEEILKHRETIQQYFGQTPRIFRNTELIYSERLLPIMDRLGFQGLVTEGVDRLLIGRSPHHVFQPNWHRDIGVLLRDYMRSDDIAFRYTDREWEHHPLEVETFAQWIDETEGEVINIFMDYETLGEHQGGETGIFRFLEDWITYTLQENLAEFVSPSQLIRSNVPSHFFTSKEWISWADTARDLSAWNGNEMQQEALAKIQELRQPMQATSRARANPQIWDTWHYLTQSDHFYYMATKEGNDGEVHQYFSPFASPHAAYLHYMNVIAHIQHQLSEWSRD